MGYDGDLLTSRALSGTLNQTLSLAYDDDFSVESVTYAGGMETFAYDDDDLLTGAGDFTPYEFPGIDVFLPYWMGRVAGVIPPPKS